MSKKFHPDKNPGDEEAAAQFLKISRAYEVLTNDHAR
jgi:DnaJ-related protein SCJ1